MNLSDLRVSVSGLSDEELLALVRDIRCTRRTPKAANGKVKAVKAKAKVESKVAISDALLASIPQDKLDELIAQLEQSKGDK
jgi:hypothetical protein